MALEHGKNPLCKSPDISNCKVPWSLGGMETGLSLACILGDMGVSVRCHYVLKDITK